MKPLLAFFDAHDIDQEYFEAELGPDYELFFTKDNLTPGTAHLAADAQVVSAHVASSITAETMQTLPKLRHIACRSTGYDHVDAAYAREHHITISTVPTYGEATVAEYAFLLLLAVSRRLLPTTQAVQAGVVTAERLTGHDLAGRTLGVIGTGRIGRHAAGIGRGFGMEVIAYDPFPNEAAAEAGGFTYASLDDLLARSDAVTLHAPATAETHHLLDAAALGKMKPGAIVINTARGTLIDTPALIEALQSGKIGGAGLDVLEGEQYLQFDAELHLLAHQQLGVEAKQILGINILQRMPNVIITSHNAYNTIEALDRIRSITVANIRASFTDQPHNLVS